MKLSFCVLVSLFSLNTWAQKHGPSDEQIAAMARHNLQAARIDWVSGLMFKRTNVRPFFEYDKTGYLVFSDDDYSGIARDMKKIVAQNLPQDVTLIIYTQEASKSYQQQLFNTYANYIPKDRLVVVQVPRSGANDFWSRDNTPIPVWDADRGALVDAQYYYNFEPDAYFGQMFGANVNKHSYFFEGGNFAANGAGDCIVVNRKASYPGGVSDTAAIPDDIFKSKYGCKRLIRLKHLKGIGHSDEVVKFMTDKIIVTDTPEYVATLQAAGLTVVLLPEPDLEYETYANALIVNDVLFVPTFGERHDQVAINAYKNLNLGYKIVPVPSRKLATQGQGGIHCITMNYPPGPLQPVVELLSAGR
jgi:agmatine/peptidylarginine deiminase